MAIGLLFSTDSTEEGEDHSIQRGRRSILLFFKYFYFFSRHFYDVVLNLSIHSLIVFTSTPCLSSSLLPSSFIIIYLLTPDEDNFLSKALVFHCSLCSVVQVTTFPYVWSVLLFSVPCRCLHPSQASAARFKGTLHQRLNFSGA